MKKLVLLISVCVVTLLAMGAEKLSPTNGPSTDHQYTISNSTPQELLDAAYDQVQWYITRNLDVPKETYDFFFKLDKLVNADAFKNAEGRNEGNGSLDQLADACPGTLIVGPDEGELTVRNYGSTISAANNCSYPNCRMGRDVMVQLEVETSGEMYIRTSGSSFDTYLCMYEGGCCGEGDSELIAWNDNNPSLCYGQRLAAGMYFPCIPSGTYYLVLDGASPSAFGSFCLTIDFSDFCND